MQAFIVNDNYENDGIIKMFNYSFDEFAFKFKKETIKNSNNEDIERYKCDFTLSNKDSIVEVSLKDIIIVKDLGEIECELSKLLITQITIETKDNYSNDVKNVIEDDLYLKIEIENNILIEFEAVK